MGLLDDAIREHLDLKRRHGADPAEIERAEREALGPVRRGPADAVDSGLSYEPIDDQAPIYDNAVEEEWHDEEVHADGEHEPHPPLAAVPPPPPLEPVHREPPLTPEHPSEETAEYDVEAALEHEENHGHRHGAEGDMLEETPEFLQDAPEHDRLWFEQRPPRDFDFDS